MSEETKIDFQALDPALDREHWAHLVTAVTARALGRRRNTVSVQLLTWARPVLAMAAALGVIVWVGAALAQMRPQPSPEPVHVLAQWAVSEEPPTAAHVLELMGADHGQR